MKKWINWHPIENLTGKIRIDSIKNTDEGLIITVSFQENKPTIEIIFDGCLDAHQYTSQYDAQTFFEKLHNKNNMGAYKYHSFFTIEKSDKYHSFFTIEKSDYLQYLDEQSCGYSNSFDFTHYCIVGNNDIFDILSRDEPTIRLIK